MSSGGGDPISQVSNDISQGFSDLNLGGSVQPMIQPVVDIGLAASGNPELIPAFNAANTYAQTGDVGQAALSGGTAYLGGQLGDLINQIPGDVVAQAPTDYSSYMQQLSDTQAAEDAAYGAAQPAGSVPTGGGISGNVYGGGGLSDLLGYAKTGAQLIGGVGQLAGGVAAMQRSGQLQGRADPMGAYRPGYASQLNQLIQNPSTITSTPGYQFNLANYMQQLQAQQAKQGNLVSGGGAVQAGQMGQQYATSQLGQQQQLLAQLAGASQSPAYGTQTAANIGTGAQGVFSGAANVLDPLATLYSKYNQPSPSVT
jgi:hypothetical protein